MFHVSHTLPQDQADSDVNAVMHRYCGFVVAKVVSVVYER